jgi:ABC-type glucose/galactose transport system permease subunit
MLMPSGRSLTTALNRKPGREGAVGSNVPSPCKVPTPSKRVPGRARSMTANCAIETSRRCRESTLSGHNKSPVGVENPCHPAVVLAGIRVNLCKVLAFAGAGLLVSVAALFELGQSGGANPLFGPELLLPAYAAAFLGVTTYRPGYFNIPGAVIAIVLLAVGFNGLNLLGVPYWLQPIFNGVVLILAVITAAAEGRQILK